MYIRGVSGGAEQADGENEPEILLEQHDIKNMTLTASKLGWETRFVLLRGENVVRGKTQKCSLPERAFILPH